jgi:hypothetical protein
MTPTFGVALVHPLTVLTLFFGFTHRANDTDVVFNNLWRYLALYFETLRRTKDTRAVILYILMRIDLVDVRAVSSGVIEMGRGECLFRPMPTPLFTTLFSRVNKVAFNLSVGTVK